MAWQTPKTDWKAGDIPAASDFNRIEGDTQYLKDEVDSHKAEDASTTAKGHVQLNNTVTSTSTTQAATANAVKTVNDGAKAYTDAHEQKAAPHSGHETPSGAQAKVDAHSSQSEPHSGHATTSALSTHTSATSAHSATSAATANRIMMRDASGRAKVAAPSAADDVARKDTVDAKFHATTGHKHTGVAGDGPKLPALESLILDQYELHTELYYTGHHSGHNIEGLKGMTFDGFVDLGRVDTSSTTATVQTGQVVCPGTATVLRPSSVSWNYDSAKIEVYKATDCIDGDLNSYTTISRIGGSGTNYATATFDLGSLRNASSLKITAALTNAGVLGSMSSFECSVDGINWFNMDISTISPTKTTKTTHTQDFSLMRLRYIRFKVGVSDTFDGLRLYEVEVTVYNYATSSYVLQSTQKQIESPITSVALYVSLSESTSVTVQVSADGVHWETATLEDSRPDPQFGMFNEYRYSKNLTYPGPSVSVKILLGTTSTKGPILKRYGLFWS